MCGTGKMTHALSEPYTTATRATRIPKRMPWPIPTCATGFRPDYEVVADECLAPRTRKLSNRDINAYLRGVPKQAIRVTLGSKKAKSIQADGLMLAAIPSGPLNKFDKINQRVAYQKVESVHGENTLSGLM
jgi:hypothetical protein